MSLGPLMIDIDGTTLSEEDRHILQNPLVGGVILFSRNYISAAQIAALCDEIHALRKPPLLIAVDHEGGRVQRFRTEFTALPACARYGELYDADKKSGLQTAEQAGWLLAAELRAVGVDFSFAPVLDVRHHISKVINDRAFHRHAMHVAELARAMMRGMDKAGMAAVGKHFPGHGSVVADSHHEIPVDERRLADIHSDDLLAFSRMIRYGLPAIMPAHVIYPALDTAPAGFSKKWIQGVLRHELGFQGTIFSDDLSMAGAAVAGSPLERAQQALAAGCDMLLVCNDRQAAQEVVTGLKGYINPASQARLLRLHGRHDYQWDTLRDNPLWQAAKASLDALEQNPELNLHDDELY